MKRIGWVLLAVGVAIAAAVTLRRVRERAEYEDEWDAETPAAVGVDEALAEEPAADEEIAGDEVVIEEVEVAVSEPVVDDEATMVTEGPLIAEPAAEVEEEPPAVVEAPTHEEPAAERDDDTMEGPSPITRLHTDRETAELRDRIAESRSRMRTKARRGRGGGAAPAEPEGGEPEAG